MKAGSTSIRLLAAGNTVFDLIDEGVESEERSTALLQKLCQRPARFIDHDSKLSRIYAGAEAWRASCNERKWIIAKNLLDN